MSELWYYAEGESNRGPLPLGELLPLLARTSDPRRVMIWREGFDGWKPVEEVHEVAQQLFRAPPPKRTWSPPHQVSARRKAKPELSGIGGWLALLACWQVLGVVNFVVARAQQFNSLNAHILSEFPSLVWMDAAMDAVVFGLLVCTAVLLFRHSRYFPRFFIWQAVVVVCKPLVALLLVSFVIGRAADQSFIDMVALIAPELGGRLIAAAIIALIWIPYVLRSRRVANTFTE